MHYRLGIFFLAVFALEVGISGSSKFENDRRFNPCLVNPCANNCTCQPVSNLDDWRYRCVNGNRSCTWDILKVNCEDDAIRISLPAWLLNQYALKYDVTMDNITSALYISNKFRPNEAKCKAVANKTRHGDITYSLTIPFPFTNCDTESEIEGDSPEDPVVVTNQVWFEKTVANFYGYPVKLVDVRCAYPRKFILESFVNPVCCSPEPFITARGAVDVHMYLWNFLPGANRSKESSLKPPISYKIGQELFVTVESSQTTGYNLTLLDCYVSPHFTVGKDFDSVDIIKDRCPAKSIHFRHEIIENGVGSRSLFVFQVFKLGEISDFYVHCHAKLCKEGCTRQCTKYRKRRYAEASLALSSGNLQRDLTKGPIHLVQEQQQHHVVKQKVKPDPGDTKHSDPFFSWMVPALLAFSNLTCVALLGALCYALARSVSARRNKRRRDRLGGTPTGELFYGRCPVDQSEHATQSVQLLSVNPQFDFAKQCSMLTPPPSPVQAIE